MQNQLNVIFPSLSIIILKFGPPTLFTIH